MILIFITISLIGLASLWLILIDRKYVYRVKILNALPPADSLSSYQKSVYDIKNIISPDRSFNDKKKQNKYFNRLGRHHKGLWIPFWSIIYKLFSSKYFAYNQYPVVYISSYGGISEVSRRKITSENGLSCLKKLRKELWLAVDNNNKPKIISTLADIYRFMYDLKPTESISPMRVSSMANE